MEEKPEERNARQVVGLTFAFDRSLPGNKEHCVSQAEESVCQGVKTQK
jgi:hypothetical protein